MRIEATRELLAPRLDAWKFLAEPYHLSDWWPGITGVVPDRRGTAAGARWQVVGASAPTLLRKPRKEGMLLVQRVDPPSLFAFHLTSDRLDVEITLAATAADRTRASVVVDGPWLVGDRRTLARRAAARLHDLIQTASTI